jgi:hypothetical protein
MRSAKLWVLATIILAVSVPAFAQTNVNEEQGMKPYDSWHGGDLDSISMTNRGLGAAYTIGIISSARQSGSQFLHNP